MKFSISNKYAKAVVLSLGVTAFVGCGKLEEFGDTNLNPNGSPDVLTSAVLTNVEVAIGGGAALIQPGLYCQYFAEPTYPGSSLYTLPQINSAGIYSGSLMDCQLIINKNTDPATKNVIGIISGGANENQIALANILQAYIYWTVTDRWGDMPYSQALKGVAVLHPKYDSQEDIYKGILGQLKAGIEGFDPSKPLVTGDVIFNGDIAKWRKVANSMRMLISLRMSKRYPGVTQYAAEQFREAFESPYGHIENNADNLTLAYPGGNYRNPWNTAGASTDNAVAKTFTDALGGLSDNRITVMASNTNGVAYGLSAAAPTSPAFALILAPSKRQESSPQVIIGAAHVWLAKAEASELGWIIIDSKEAYDNGVKASFEEWGVSIPSTYLTTGPANFNTGAGVASIGGPTVAGSNAATSSKLARIALQQWIAYYPNGLQGWSVWRKSEGYGDGGSAVPDLKPTVNSRNESGEIVRRYVYGVTEYALNNDQLQIAIGNMPGGDDQDSRVWWDRN